MSRTSAIARGRAFALGGMLDAVTVEVLGDVVTNPTTGAVTNARSTVYTGPARVQTYEPQEGTPEVAGATVTVQRYSVHVPVGSFAPTVGMVVTVTASALDANLVGRVFRVVALLHKTAATAYRLSVEEVL